MKVILISGKAQHGKDTLAGMLKNHLEDKSYRVLIAHYGDLVKYVCEKFFNWDGNKDEAGRTLLQYVGTDVVRKQNENFWAGFITFLFLIHGSSMKLNVLMETLIQVLYVSIVLIMTLA